MRYVAWMKAPGSCGLGNSVAIGEEADVERIAREIEATPRWRLHHPQTEVTITKGANQRIVRTFRLPATSALHENDIQSLSLASILPAAPGSERKGE